VRSQQKADEAYKAGRLQEELTPVPLRNSKGEATGETLTRTIIGVLRLRWKAWQNCARRSDRRQENLAR